MGQNNQVNFSEHARKNNISVLNKSVGFKGPVKIQNNEYIRKPMTPDTTNIGK